MPKKAQAKRARRAARCRCACVRASATMAMASREGSGDGGLYVRVRKDTKEVVDRTLYERRHRSGEALSEEVGGAGRGR